MLCNKRGINKQTLSNFERCYSASYTPVYTKKLAGRADDKLSFSQLYRLNGV